MKNVPKVVVSLDGGGRVHDEAAEELHPHDGVDEEEHPHQHADVRQGLQTGSSERVRSYKMS